MGVMGTLVTVIFGMIIEKATSKANLVTEKPQFRNVLYMTIYICKQSYVFSFSRSHPPQPSKKCASIYYN